MRQISSMDDIVERVSTYGVDNCWKLNLLLKINEWNKFFINDVKVRSKMLCDYTLYKHTTDSEINVY